MRVAHVITRMVVGGAQENTLYNCQDLVEHHGDEVVLITGPALGPEGDLLTRNLRPLDFPIQLLPSLRRAIHPWRDLVALREIRKAIQAFQPDVVHTHSAKGGFLGRIAASQLRIPAIVHTVHGAPFHPYQSWFTRTLYRQCEQFAAKRCHRMISVADAMTDLMVEARVEKREKFTTIYSGMDVQPFVDAHKTRQATRDKFGFRENDVVIGKIARIFHLKGQEYVVDAAAKVIATNPNVKFLFVGDGLLREAIEQKIQSLGLGDHFVFAGLVYPDEIPALIGGMDALVHASLREGLARALPQALLAGIPAVSFDIDGAKEVVITGETGELLKSKDVEGLADSILTLADIPDLRRSLGEEGRRRCLDVFPHELMTRRIRELYEQILAEGS